MIGNEPIYREKQRFRQWWVWLFILAGPAFLLGVVLHQTVLGSGADYVSILLTIILGGGFPVLFYFTGLDTEVRNCGLYIRFRPFHRKWVVFRFVDITKAEAMTYSPIKDYGGWGIRHGWQGKAYNVSGNKGVMLTLCDDRQLMIGSSNSKALCLAVNEGLSRRDEL